MELNLMKKTAALSVLFALTAMGVILYLSGTRPAAGSGSARAEALSGGSQDKALGGSPESVEGTALSGDRGGLGSVFLSGSRAATGKKSGEETQGTSQSGEEAQSTSQSGNRGEIREHPGNAAPNLTFIQSEADTSYLRIPLPKGCRAEDIVIENYYMDQELCVLIGTDEEDFYAENAISGNQEKVRQGTYEPGEESVKLRFQLTGVFEYRTILENDDLYVSFLSPKEMYDKIVVIDAACGGFNTGYQAGELEEKEINLQIVRKLKEKLDKTDIKAYYTRMDDVNPQEEERVRLANETRADLYIRIQVDADKDSAVYGTTTLYNGDYFIPGFGSVELADLLEKEVVTSIKGKALGLFEAESSEYAIRHVTVPAAAVKVGFATNKQEAGLLAREEYQEKIAQGIYNAIVKACEDEN